MNGEHDPLHIKARRALLDVLGALEPHLDAIVLVGAQAVYVHTRNTELAVDLGVAEYTTDADVAMRPSDLADSPLLEKALEARGFTHGADPGRWVSPEGVYVDLMVPEALAGSGRRAARLGPHGKAAARRAKGLEGALIDRERHVVTALDPEDQRSVTIWVAGPAALLVAKIHKIAERTDRLNRLQDKDALDVLRLLRAVPTRELVDGLQVLGASELAGKVTDEAITHLRYLFAGLDSEGVQMMIRAAGTRDQESKTLAASMVILVGDALDLLG